MPKVIIGCESRSNGNELQALLTLRQLIFIMYQPSEISDIEMLSAYLRTDVESLSKLINGNKFVYGTFSPLNADLECFKDVDLSIAMYSIPKKNPKLGFRNVFEIEDQFAVDILKVLKFNLEELYTPHECTHGFVKGRNIATNAKPHLGKEYLLNLDLKNFFETIEKDRVALVFEKLGFNYKISLALAAMTTLSGRLVQGFHTSPIIANLVAYQLDAELYTFCISQEAIYSRYADDISVSSNATLPNLEEITQIILKNGFILNDSKSKFFKRGQNQFVTGLSVFDNDYPRIPKKIKKRIRQELYYIIKFGIRSHMARRVEDGILEGSGNSFILNRIKGWIDYINAIEPKVAKKFYDSFNRIKVLEKERLERQIKNDFGIIDLRALDDEF